MALGRATATYWYLKIKTLKIGASRPNNPFFGSKKTQYSPISEGRIGNYSFHINQFPWLDPITKNVRNVKMRFDESANKIDELSRLKI